MHIPSAELRTFFHSKQSQESKSIREVGFAEANSVVLNHQNNVLIFLAQRDAHRLCLRMPNHVGQALLEDSECRSSPVAIQV